MVVFMWFIGDTLISLFTTDTAVREICRGPVSYTHLDVYKRQTQYDDRRRR